jgi:hypothetical protein
MYKHPVSETMAEQLMGIITSSWMSQAIYVAAQLGIADHLAEGPRTADELARSTGTHAPSLRRLLRALTTIGLCRERDDMSFELTPLGSLLQTKSPASLRHWAIYWGGHLWRVWGHLIDSIKTGESGRKSVTGTEGFQHLEQDPALAAIFHRAMAELTHLSAQEVVRSYNFLGISRVVDVGGGCGELLSAILKTNSAARGVLFELPHVIEDAKRHLAEVGLADQCEFVAGSFFESVPRGGEVYLLKSILHDWDDDQCRMILQNCRRAMTDGGRLLLIERIMPAQLESSGVHQSMVRSDLHMLVALAGRERTEVEFHSLLNSAGLQMVRILPAGPILSIMEAISSPEPILCGEDKFSV